MIYFKTVLLENENGQRVESAIRKFASKRNTSLDFQSTSSDIGTEKFFLGVESQSDIKISRIRTSFERLLPKLIVSFPKDKGFTCYKVRFSILPSVLAFFFVAAILSNTFFFIRDQRTSNNFMQVIFFLALFLLLTYFELQLTRKKIQTAIIKSESEKQNIQ